MDQQRAKATDAVNRLRQRRAGQTQSSGQKHPGFFTKEEAQRTIADIMLWPDELFPVRAELNNGCGIILKSRQDLISDVKANLWKGED